MQISVVIPALDEAAALPAALAAAARALGPGAEVIVADGDSRDATPQIARAAGAAVVRAPPGRAAAMNRGAETARGEVLLFLHADTLLPAGAGAAIEAALARPRVVGGCFRLRFDSPRRLLALYAWFTRFPCRLFHYGDAGYFVRREAFEALGGYRELPLMEDVDLWLRMRRLGRVAVAREAVVTSARRYERAGALRQQARNTALVLLFLAGVPARRLRRFYPHVR